VIHADLGSKMVINKLIIKCIVWSMQTWAIKWLLLNL
jgi:hypothetical protein